MGFSSSLPREEDCEMWVYKAKYVADGSMDTYWYKDQLDQPFPKQV